MGVAGGNDTIYALDGDDELIGGRGDDALYGGYGGNVYRIGRGDGFDSIYTTYGASDAIVFGPGITADNLRIQFRSGGWNDQEVYASTALAIGFGNNEGVLIQDDPDASSNGDLFNFGLKEVRFADGSSLSLDELIARADGGVIGEQVLNIWGSEGLVRGSVAQDSITGGEYSSDRIDARDQNDVIYGLGCSDVISGGDGDDEIHGGDSGDIIAGGRGNDYIDAGEGSNVVAYNQGDGADVVSLANAWQDGLSLGGGIRAEQVAVYRTGPDELVFLDGKSGDSVTVFGDLGFVQFIDDAGARLVFNYEDLRDAFSAELAAATAENPFALFVAGAAYAIPDPDVNFFNNALAYSQFGDIFAEPLYFELGAADDVVTGSALSDEIDAGDGNNTVMAGAGNDLILAGCGDDFIDAGAGDDFIDAGQGEDLILAGDGDDTVQLGYGSNAQVVGGAGDDTYQVRYEAEVRINDLAQPGEENTLMFRDTMLQDLTLSIEDGLLHIGGSGGVVNVLLDNFDATDPHGSRAVDSFRFGAGGTGGVLSYDELLTQRGLTIYGSSNADALMVGSRGGDRIYSCGGNDYIVGGKGDDLLYGDQGNDTYIFNRGDGADSIHDEADEFSGNTLRFGAGITEGELRLSTAEDPNNCGNCADVMTIHVGNGEDSVSLYNVWRDDFESANPVENFQFADGTTLTWHELLDRNIYLEGTPDQDWLRGLARDTIFHGAEGDDYLFGQEGNDTYLYSIGDDSDVISDRASAQAGNAIQFGDGIAADDIGLSLVCGCTNVLVGDQSIVLENSYRDDLAGTPTVMEFRFADGTNLSWEALLTRGVDIAGTSDDDFLNGTSVADRIVGGEGNDWLSGGEGDDSYFFNLGDGRDRIGEETSNGTQNTVVFGAGISIADIHLSLSGEGLFVEVGDGEGIVLAVDPVNLDGEHSIEKFRFADGTVFSWNDLLGLGIRVDGTSENDLLFGSNHDDTLHGGTGNDVLVGGGWDNTSGGSGGYDTYLYHIDDGADAIADVATRTEGNRVVFGSGIASEDVALHLDEGRLVLHTAIDGDSIALAGFDALDPSGVHAVESFEFENGTVLSYADLLARGITIEGTADDDLLLGTAARDLIHGGEGHDTLGGGVGGDVLDGGAGDDTYLYQRGDSKVTIIDAATLMEGNTLHFGDGITLDDMVRSLRFKAPVGDEPGEFIIRLGDIGDEAHISGFDPVDPEFGPHGVENFAFADGTTVSFRQMIRNTFIVQGGSNDDVLTGTAMGDRLYGYEGNDVLTSGDSDDALTGGTGDDSMQGGAGNDVYILDLGAGNDTIVDSTLAAADNLLVFGAGIGRDGLSFEVEAGGLRVRYSPDDSVLLQGWSPSDGEEVVHAVEFADGSQESLASLLNTAPVLMVPPVDATAVEDSAFSWAVPAGTFADLDAGDVLSYVVNGADGAPLPEWISFNAESLTLSGTAGNADVGSFIAEVTATDRFGRSTMTSFTVSTANTNDAPETGAALVAQVATEDSAFAFTLPATAFGDVDLGDSLILSASLANGDPLPGWLGFDAASGSFTGTPLNDDVGSLAIVVSASDLAGATASQAFVLDAANTNDAPIIGAAIPDAQATEDAGFEFVVPATAFADVDRGDTLALSAMLSDGNVLPAWLFFDAATHAFSGTPGNDDVGSFGVKLSAFDLAATSASQVFTVSAGNTNDAPETDQAIPPQVVTEDSSFGFTIPASAFKDVDFGDSLSLSARLANGDALPGWVNFDAATASFSGTPLNDDVGVLSVAVVATDAAGASASQIFALSVANTNDAPEVGGEIGAQAATEDSAFTFAVPATAFGDVDVGDVLTLSATLANGDPLPAWLSFDAATATFSGTSLNDDVGSLSVSVVATDAAGASTSQTFSLSVANTNDAPETGAALVAQAATEDSPFAFTLPESAFKDVDFGDSLSLSARLANGDALPGWLRFDAATASFTGTPLNDDVGVLSVSVVATDAADTSASQTVALSVANTNDAPEAVGAIAAQVATEDGAFSFIVPATAFGDVDVGDVLSLSPTLANGDPLPGWLTFDSATATFSGTPLNEDVGSLSLLVVATDAAGASASQVFTVSVANTNDAPVAASVIGPVMVTEDSGFQFAVPDDAFQDVDLGDSLSYGASLADSDPLPAWLLFDATTRTFSGTPANEDVGTVAVRLSATDGSGASATQVFSLGVINVNDLPLTTGDIGSVVEDVSISASGNVLANDRDPDVGDVLIVADTGTRQGSYGQLTLAASGDWTYQLDAAASQVLGAGEAAVEQFTYSASDGQLAAPGMIDIAVVGCNDAPMLSAALAAVKVKAGSLFSWTLPATSFVDPDLNDRLGYSASLADGSPLPSWLSFDAATRAFSGTPALNDLGELNVRLTATDGSGASAAGTMKLTVALTLPGKTFIGTPHADTLSGTEDDDVFDGRCGADTLIGRGGDDLYLVTDQKDPIVEQANGGFDSVWADTSFTLPDQIEALAFVGAGDYTGNGNGLGNLLVGNRGDNSLDGKAGDDILLGQAGDDTLLGGAGLDALDGGSGDDQVEDGEGAGFIAGGRGDDTIRLVSGADIIAFNRGDDADRIQGGDGQNDTLSLGGGIRVGDIRLQKNGKDLIVNTGKGDSLQFADWYKNGGGRTIATLQVAADAGGMTFERYNFIALVEKFDAVLAANKRIDSWTPGSEALRFKLDAATSDVAGGSLAAAYASSGTLDGIRPETASVALATSRSDATATSDLPDVPLPPRPSTHGGPHDDRDGHGHDDRHERDDHFRWKSESGPFLSPREVEAAWQSWQHAGTPPPSVSPIDYAMGWARLRDRLAGRLDEGDYGGAWCDRSGGARQDGFSLLSGGRDAFGSGNPIGLPGAALKPFEGLKEGFERLHGS